MKPEKKRSMSSKILHTVLRSFPSILPMLTATIGLVEAFIQDLISDRVLGPNKTLAQ